MGYRIKTVAELTGVSRSTLIAWERRYGLVSPVRATNGYRMYSESDVVLLRRVKSLVDRGLKISEAITLLDSGQADPAREIARALLARDTGRAERIFAGVGGSFRAVVDAVVLPSAIQVNRSAASRIAKNAAYQWLSEILRGMLRDIEYGPMAGFPVIAAGYAEAEHDVFLLSWAVNLAVVGCRVHYLGRCVGPLQLANATASLKPTIIVQAPCLRASQADLEVYLEELVLPVPLALVGPGVGQIERPLDPEVWICPLWEDLMAAWPRLGAAAGV